jgi:hypothetical protein
LEEMRVAEVSTKKCNGRHGAGALRGGGRESKTCSADIVAGRL